MTLPAWHRRRPCHPTAFAVYLAGMVSRDPLQDIMYSRPVPKLKWCVYAVTVHVCAVKRLHTRNLGLKNKYFRYTEATYPICSNVPLLL